jgi:hypothetical protein
LKRVHHILSQRIMDFSKLFLSGALSWLSVHWFPE